MLLTLKSLWIEQWRGVKHTFRQCRWHYLVGFIVMAVVGLVILPFDSQLLALIRQPENTFLTKSAQALGKYGDIWPATLVLSLLFWGSSYLLKWSYGRRLALCCLAAAVFAGATVNVFRPTLGRPRPKAELEDRFHGPSFEHKFHGFPSGHAGAAFATATSVAVALPPVGVPLLVGATAVGWSRMQLNNHHPTDVWVGALIGIGWGFAFGRGIRSFRYKKPVKSKANS
jgi:membrane-associated phospholipid phosphatase